MWELRTVGSMGTAGFYPYELNDTTNMKNYTGLNLLIARNTFGFSINDTANDLAGFSASIAKKIDAKYDDGMPYTGDIIAGQNIGKFGTGKGCTTSTTITTSSPAVSISVNYVGSNNKDLSTGCVLAWVLR